MSGQNSRLQVSKWERKLLHALRKVRIPDNPKLGALRDEMTVLFHRYGFQEPESSIGAECLVQSLFDRYVRDRERARIIRQREERDGSAELDALLAEVTPAMERAP